MSIRLLLIPVIYWIVNIVVYHIISLDNKHLNNQCYLSLPYQKISLLMLSLYDVLT